MNNTQALAKLGRERAKRDALAKLRRSKVAENAVIDRADTVYTRLVQDVAAARAAGATWHEIGDVLGVTRQAATARFAANGKG